MKTQLWPVQHPQSRGAGAPGTHLPEAEALAQAGQLPLHAAIPPTRCQPAPRGEEPGLAGVQLLHYHAVQEPARGRPTAVVPEADPPEWAQVGRGAGDTKSIMSARQHGAGRVATRRPCTAAHVVTSGRDRPCISRAGQGCGCSGCCWSLIL